MNSTWFKEHEHQVIGLILLLAFVHGLLYVFTMPPWQHYDEPTHFEYAWTIADTGQLPTPGEYDWDFRADLVRSLIENDFYAGMPRVPDPDRLQDASLPAGLQFPQLDDPPLYYLLVSLPLRSLKGTDLAGQVLAARQVSLLLFLLTILAAWGTMREISKPGSPWRFFVPLTMALLPGFVDLMTAVNSDVGAVVVFSLFLWGAARMIQRGASLLTSAWVLLTAVAAFYTKSSAYFAVPLAFVALVLGYLPGRLRRFAWLALGAGGLAAALALLYVQEPAYWYRATSQAGPVRERVLDAPHGSYALAIDPSARLTPRWLKALNQPVSLDEVERLRGSAVTLGAWMWLGGEGAAQLQVLTPAVNIDVLGGDDLSFAQAATITTTPQFFSVVADIPEDAVRVWVSLNPKPKNPPEGITIYYDAVILSEGIFPEGSLPGVNDAAISQGDWGAGQYANLLRNASAEKAWPAFRPWADNFAASLLPNNVRPSILLYTLMDQDGAGFYYLSAGENIFKTFWARFGWGHVEIPDAPFLYPLFAALTGLALLGVVTFPYGESESLPVDVLLFFGLTLLALWGAAFARGAIFIFVDHVFIPSARYAFPAITPTVLVLVAGWFGLAGYALKRLHIPAVYFYIFYTIALLAFDYLSLTGITAFYSALY